MGKRQSETKQTAPSLSVFDLQAELGITKHMGGQQATDELAELCCIDASSSVLDVGCGVGLTSCYLAETIGCRVTGVDISARMVFRSEERASKAHLLERVRFKTGDIERLPYDDDEFDVVLVESVVSLLEKKRRAVSECVRVVKPRGFVGFNESVWIKTPPEGYSQGLSYRSGVNVGVIETDEWDRLLRENGLRDLVVRTYAADVRSELRGTIRRIGYRELLRVWSRAFRLYRKDPAYRDFVREAMSEPKEMLEYLGRGMFVGRKSQPVIL
jgi:arsenite methyltransferase